jgi:predicted unusual protein kinase regulating ubiquinone biosynthesis (AarF/ABC1/UbiB family)
VLTLEFMDGLKINDLAGLEAAGVDRPALARRLLELYLQMFLDDGFYHADPHPGNVFARPDGVVQLIDFGLVGAIPEAMRHDFLELVRAVLTADGGGAVSALERLGFLGPGADRRRLEAALEPVCASLSADLGSLFQGSGMLAGRPAAGGQRAGARPQPDWDQLRQFIWSQPITLPGNITFLGKTFITLISDCYKLDPALDLAAAVGPRVRSLAGGDDWRQLASRLGADGLELARAAVPTAKHLVSLARRLEVGDLEVGLNGAQLAALVQAGQRQTQRLVRALTAAVAALAGLGLALVGPHPWVGLALGAVGGLGLLLMSLPRRR